MKVKEVMVGTPYSCRPETNLGAAAEMMWNGNCGFLPVVGPDEKVCGVITDRDICMALGTRNQSAGEVTVGDVTQYKVFACAPEDDVHIALQTMKEGHVRRLPVVAVAGTLVGVISMDDILLKAEPARMGREPELSTDEVVRTFRSINQREAAVATLKKSVAA